MGIKAFAITNRKGQAFIELALGMFALSLVISALATFAIYIVQSLKLQDEARLEAGQSAMISSGSDMIESMRSDSIELDAVAAEYFFGSKAITINEKAYLPRMKGM